jgi:CheY-like chemotaxis protein
MKPEGPTRQQASHTCGKVLIVAERPLVRQSLVRLVRSQIKSDRCLEVENAECARNALEKQDIEFAVVGCSRPNQRGPHLTDRIKLTCPSLPVLAVQGNPYLSEQGTHLPENTGSSAGNDRILAGIRYVQSLTESGVSGFTVLVKAERYSQ